MTHHDIKAEIRTILDDPQLGKAAKIDRLERMREDARAEMRAATESTMADDTDTGDHLKHLDQALNDLGAHPETSENKGAATL